MTGVIQGHMKPQFHSRRAHSYTPYLSLPVRGVDKNNILRELVIRDEDVVQLVIHGFPGNLETVRCPHKEMQHPGLSTSSHGSQYSIP